MKKRAHTIISVLGGRWSVPRGFGEAYKRFVRADLELVGRGRPGAVITGVRDLLLLVGYDASRETIANWPLRKRVEAAVYAATEHARAGDNPVRRHPKPRWLPKPWCGPRREASAERLGVFAGPEPTEVS